jgi:hypothetical protein
LYPFVNYIESPVIIIGMHRSGTTLLSQLFNQAGIFQGVFRDHNSEAFHFLSINQQTLEKSGSDWLAPAEPPSQDWYSISAEELYAIHFQIGLNPIKIKWLKNQPWGWKDPRNTFTLPMYLKLFPKAKVIHLIRNGKDVALSLKHRNSVEGEVVDTRLDDLLFNFNLWETYVEKGSSYKEKVDTFIEVKYEDLLDKNADVLEKIHSWGNVDFKPHLVQVKDRRENQYPEELNEVSLKSKTFKKWYGE